VSVLRIEIASDSRVMEEGTARVMSRMMIFGPKSDATYVLESTTASASSRASTATG
jgi:hypothetical protein